VTVDLNEILQYHTSELAFGHIAHPLQMNLMQTLISRVNQPSTRDFLALVHNLHNVLNTLLGLRPVFVASLFRLRSVLSLI
jgi:hypothetical protein